MIPESIGTYRFIASTAADANNEPATTLCADAGGAVTVTQATPELVISKPVGAVAVGELITAKAFLMGGYAMTGAVQLRIYGPGDPACTGPGISTTSLPLAGQGLYQGAGFSPTAPGAHRMVASYAGDVLNHGAESGCAAGAFEVGPAAPAPPGPGPAGRTGKRAAALKKCKKAKRKPAKKRCVKKAKRLPV